MTVRYVWDNSLQDDSDAFFNSSTVAYTTWQAALTASTPGTDIILVAHDHTETGASFTWTAGNVAGVPQVCYSVNRTTRVYQVGDLSPYQFATTSAANDMTWTNDMCLYGMTFDVDDNMTMDENQRFQDCILRVGTVASIFKVGEGNFGNCQLINCTIISTGSNECQINANGNVIIDGLDASGCSLEPFDTNTARPGHIVVKNSNLDDTGSHNLLDSSTAFGTTASHIWDFVDCKLRSGQTIIAASSIDMQESSVNLWNCDDDTSDLRYRNESYQRAGTVITGTTNTRLYTDAANGGTAVSHIMTPDASNLPSQSRPLRGIPCVQYVEAAGTPSTITVKVECLEHNASLTLTDTEIWFEVSFKSDSAGSPKSTMESSRTIDPIEGTGSTVTASSDASWNVTTGKSKFYLEYTTTANLEQDGLVELVMHLGSNDTVTYDPEFSVTVN